MESGGSDKVDRVKNEDIRQRLKQEAVVEAHKKQRVWKENVDGMEGARLVVRVEGD